MKAYFDTNVLVAALYPAHVHHERCLAVYLRVKENLLTGFLSAHGLAELYSVLTRTAFVHPVTPEQVRRMIDESVRSCFNLIAVTGESHLAAIAACARGGWKGGRIHDAVHIEAARQAGCDVLYTYDVGHFRSLAPEWADRIQTPPGG
jgi:predicted nucleic acid-binding protein